MWVVCISQVVIKVIKEKWYEMIEVLNEFQDAAANDCKLQALKR